MSRQGLGMTVFDMAIDRMIAVYEQGHRVVVSFSGGKDSTCLLEVCIAAARLTNRLPVEVVLQDEEIAFPGTYEYAERTAKRPEVRFNWLIMNHPMINCFNRSEPYFWVLDPQLPPDQWVRQPPTDPACNVQYVPEKEIQLMTAPWRFTPPVGKQLYAAMGLRASESKGRLFGYHSSGSYITKPNEWGVRNVRPIIDWQDGDVWKAILDNKWDYNTAYDTMYRWGIKKRELRVAPPTMNPAGLEHLKCASECWPQWFAKVADRLPGVRTAAMFGKRAVLPTRQLGETWEECFQRFCIDDAPEWMKHRCEEARRKLLSAHRNHSGSPFPEVQPCRGCNGSNGSWKALANGLAYGDPFSTKFTMLQWVEPEVFRPGAGTYLGQGKALMKQFLATPAGQSWEASNPWEAQQ